MRKEVGQGGGSSRPRIGQRPLRCGYVTNDAWNVVVVVLVVALSSSLSSFSSYLRAFVVCCQRRRRALVCIARMRTELATHCWSSSDSLVTSDTRPRLPQLRAPTKEGKRDRTEGERKRERERERERERPSRERCTVAPPRPACQSVHAFDASQ